MDQRFKKWTQNEIDSKDNDDNDSDDGWSSGGEKSLKKLLINLKL